MKFRDILEIIRRRDPEMPAGELAINLNGYYKDICNFIEPFFAVASFEIVEPKTAFELTDFDATLPERFMKLRNVFRDERPLKPMSNSIQGDGVYGETLTGIQAGFRSNDGLTTFPTGTIIELVYYSYAPAITVNTVELPLPWAHPMILWRVKADMHADMREWDRAGYYNRRYERSLVEYRKMYRSSGPQKIVNPNSEI